MAFDKSKPTQLYRAFTEEGDLLYVGISLSVFSRLSAHKKTAEWFEKCSRIDVETFPNRSQAEKAEMKAIKTEFPKFNKQGKVKEPPKSKWDYLGNGCLRADSLERLFYRVKQFHKIGESQKKLEREIEILQSKMRENLWDYKRLRRSFKTEDDLLPYTGYSCSVTFDKKPF